MNQEKLEARAADILTRIPLARAEVMAFCLGYLDQAVKNYLRGTFTVTDLEDARQLTETVLDLHATRREADHTC